VRWLGRIVLVMLVLLVVALGAALAFLPRMIRSPEFRQTVEQLLEQRTGRSVTWRDLSLGLLPPSIVIEEARVAGESEAAPALLRADEISLRLSIWPLLAGVVLVDSLVVDGAVVELDLDAEGLSLPSLPDSESEPGQPPSESAVRVAARRVTLRDSKLVLVDRTRTPPVTWTLEQLRFELEATAPSAPVSFEGGGLLAGGDGGFSVTGQATLAGEVEARVSLEALRVDRLAPYVPNLSQLGGDLSGRIDLRAGGGAPLGLKADLQIPDAVVASGDLRIAGGLALTARTEGEGPVSFTADLKLASGGRLEAKGSTTRDGVLDVRLALSDVDLALARPLVGTEVELAGAASGQVALHGPASRLAGVNLDLSITDARVRRGELGVDGPLSFTVDLSALQPTAKGRLSLEASAARIAWSDVFVKAAGVPARLSGVFGRSAKGELGLDLDSLFLASLQGSAKLRSGARTTLSVTAATFDVAPVAALVPALSDLKLHGQLALESFGATLEPLALSGAIVLAGLSLAPPPERGLVVLHGRAEGRGDGIRLVDATCTVGEGNLVLAGGITDLLGQQRFDLQFESRDVLRTNPLMSNLTSVKDTVYGPLVVKGRLAGRSGGVGREELLQSLEGGLEFDIGEGASHGAEGGRIKDFSLLHLVVDQLGAMGGAVLIAGSAGRGKSLEKFYDDRFRVLQGVFEVRDGILATRKLRLVYPSYGAELQGNMRLVDLALDMKGRIELGQAVVSQLGGTQGGSPVVIPIASIRGTFEDPKLSLTAETVTALVRQLLLEPRVLEGATRQLDRVLPGVSDILKGGKSR